MEYLHPTGPCTQYYYLLMDTGECSGEKDLSILQILREQEGAWEI
jgi:hypothetical protein